MSGIERWAPVPGYPGYEVSDHGQVRSLDRQVRSRWGTPKTLKGKMLSRALVGSNGPVGKYWGCVLYRDGKRRSAMVHNLVLEAFVGPRPEGLWGLHRDDDPNNNRLANLYWGTPSANVIDKIRNGNHHEVNKTHCPQGHEYSADNISTRSGARAGHRQCKTCRQDQHRERYRLKKAAEGKAVRPPARERTHCPYGHAYDEANTAIYGGSRVCRACMRRRATERGLSRPRGQS